MKSENNIRGRDVFKKMKIFLDILTVFYKIFPINIRKWLLVKHRRTYGKIGMGIRYCLLKSIAVECGDNVAIYEDVYFSNLQNLYVSNNVSFHPMCYIECGKSKALGLRIDSDVSIAHGVTIMSNEHIYNDKSVPIKDKPVITKPIQIEANVWIGAKASILAGVKIKSGCIIGANAVVTKDTEEDKVYVGIPARIIKER